MLKDACWVAACSLVIFAYLMMAPHRAQAQGEASAIIYEGEAMLGTPYSQLTCAEFTRLAYGRAIGVWMPASYVKQRSYGRPVYGALKDGDLLMYENHVGIYDDGLILHSSSYYGRVVLKPMGPVDSASNPYDDYLGARRIR